MDIIKQLGELAFGSRLKRISNSLMSDGVEIYRSHNIDFEPKWFPAFYYLNEMFPEPAGVTDIAQSTGVSHPLINRFINELQKKGYVIPVPDEGDKRRRRVKLSKNGRIIAEQLRPVWNDIDLSLKEIVSEADPQLMNIMARLEARLDSRGLRDTYFERMRERQYQSIRIHINRAEDFRAFTEINLEWIKAYFGIESSDLKVLDNPQKLIDAGGFIIAAQLDGEVLGVCALINLGEGAFELSKMGVTPEARGKRIGKRLMNAAIEMARQVGARVIYLETNNSLKAAINLYQQSGFEFTPQSHLGTSEYARANVFMKLEL